MRGQSTSAGHVVACTSSFPPTWLPHSEGSRSQAGLFSVIFSLSFLCVSSLIVRPSHCRFAVALCPPQAHALPAPTLALHVRATVSTATEASMGKPTTQGGSCADARFLDANRGYRPEGRAMLRRQTASRGLGRVSLQQILSHFLFPSFPHTPAVGRRTHKQTNDTNSKRQTSRAAEGDRGGVWFVAHAANGGWPQQNRSGWTRTAPVCESATPGAAQQTWPWTP